jgi:hypothetical protein
MATSSSATLDDGIGFDVVIAEPDRLVRAGSPAVRPICLFHRPIP